MAALSALLLAFVPSSAGALAFVQPEGSPFPTTNPPFGNGFLGGIAAGDFTGDGISDVAVVNATGVPISQSGESVTVLLGSRSGRLTIAPGSPIGVYTEGDLSEAGSVAVGDFTDDGTLDLAVVNEINHTVSILLGDGAGRFQPTGAPIHFGGNGFASIAVGDFTGNGKQDLAVVNSDLNVLLGDGAGGFTPAPGPALELSGFPSSVVAGDFNGDGRSDLAVASQPDDVTVYLSTGAGEFREAPGSPVTTGSVYPRAIAAADLTGDDTLDLVTANGESNNVSVLLGNGSGGFVPTSDSPFPLPPDPGPQALPGNANSIAVGDFASDGKPDIAAANLFGGVTILEGNGNGDFTKAVGSPFDANANPGPFVVGDFNGDGKPDIAVANSFLGAVTVLDNTAADALSTPPQFVPSPGLEPSPAPKPSAVGAPTVESLALNAHTIRARHGVTLKLTLSGPGDVVVKFERTVSEHLHGHKRKALEILGSVTLAGKAGVNSFTIKRVKGRLLPDGGYTLVIYTKLGAEESTAHTIALMVRH